MIINVYSLCYEYKHHGEAVVITLLPFISE